MKEFMLFVHAVGNPIKKLSFKDQKDHIRKVGEFFFQLDSAGILIAAQPLKREGVVLSSKNGERTEMGYDDVQNSIVGYYQITANDLEAALQIARLDPRFGDSDWTIEVRPIMTMEGLKL